MVDRVRSSCLTLCPVSGRFGHNGHPAAAQESGNGTESSSALVIQEECHVRGPARRHNHAEQLTVPQTERWTAWWDLGSHGLTARKVARAVSSTRRARSLDNSQVLEHSVATVSMRRESAIRIHVLARRLWIANGRFGLPGLTAALRVATARRDGPVLYKYRQKITDNSVSP